MTQGSSKHDYFLDWPFVARKDGLTFKSSYTILNIWEIPFSSINLLLILYDSIQIFFFIDLLQTIDKLYIYDSCRTVKCCVIVKWKQF